MKILFEEYGYDTEDVKNILGGLLSDFDLQKTKQQLKYVGYFYNKDIVNNSEDGQSETKGDLVFILPKVLLDKEGLAFGLDPKEIIDFNYKKWKSDDLVVEEGKLSKRDIYNFIYGFATWIYRAVDLYRRNLKSKKDKEDEEDAEFEIRTSIQIGKGGKKKNPTYLDVLLSLLDYQREHKDFITFVIKIAHSGFNKVSWPKTIARTSAILQDESPVYLNPINRTRVVNFDEELLIIYYSILNYMHDEYGFPIPKQPGYKLINGALFKSYLKNQGKTRLHKIRYKYFSDDAVLLWNLCYAFFDKADNIKAQTNRKDYLLVNKFEGVFEAMIDELVGDKNLPKGLKMGADDKRIDHLYTYKYLMENLDAHNSAGNSDSIYNIADSKYYRRDKKLNGHDVPKQFTYARNVIQWHMDLLHELLKNDVGEADEKKYSEIPLYDKVTEGFNIIPNFFISALVDENLNYDENTLKPTKLENDSNVYESYIYWERLFDRNSYFTLHYDVNFLYILKMYAQNKSFNKATWKQSVRDKFRAGILDHLNKEFNFYQLLIPEDKISDFVNLHYRKLIGKVFSFKEEKNHSVLVYAERKTQNDGNGKSYEYTENDAHISKNQLYLLVPGKNVILKYGVKNIRLGQDKYADVSRRIFLAGVDYDIVKNGDIVKLELVNSDANYLGEILVNEEFALIAYFKDMNQLEWIKKNEIYNVRVKMRSEYERMGEGVINARYLILHNSTYGDFVYRINSVLPHLMAKEELPSNGLYTPSKDYYMVYNIDSEKEVDDELLSELPRIENLWSNLRGIRPNSPFPPMAISVDKLHQLAANVTAMKTIRYELDNDSLCINMFAAEDEEQYGE